MNQAIPKSWSDIQSLLYTRVTIQCNNDGNRATISWDGDRFLYTDAYVSLETKNFNTLIDIAKENAGDVSLWSVHL